MARWSLLFAALVLISSPAPARADPDFSKWGISQHDLERYRSLTAIIPSCATVWAENKDPMHPVAAQMGHYARLYAKCRAELEARHESLGVLRANDVFLGLACMGAAMTDDTATAACNLKPYLPDSR